MTLARGLSQLPGGSPETGGRIGRGLRERYQAPEELPPSVLTLVRKLDALEGNHLSRECRERLRAQT